MCFTSLGGMTLITGKRQPESCIRNKFGVRSCLATATLQRPICNGPIENWD
jgi:hypothetical protein